MKGWKLPGSTKNCQYLLSHKNGLPGWSFHCVLPKIPDAICWDPAVTVCFPPPGLEKIFYRERKTKLQCHLCRRDWCLLQQPHSITNVTHSWWDETAKVDTPRCLTSVLCMEVTSKSHTPNTHFCCFILLFCINYPPDVWFGVLGPNNIVYWWIWTSGAGLFLVVTRKNDELLSWLSW